MKTRRRSIRLSDYDYGQAGGYFITICTGNRESLFGEIIAGKMVLNPFGLIVQEEWLRSSFIRKEIELDAFVIMPNHFHGIVIIIGEQVVGATGRSPLRDRPHGPQKKSLGSLVGGFKSTVTMRINRMRGTPRKPVWQRNYYEHVIRNEIDLKESYEYIENNPLNWLEDKNNPLNIKGQQK